MTYNRSLRSIVAFKFLIVLFVITTLLFIFLPIGLKTYFIEEAYRTIEISQEGYVITDKTTTIDPRTVNHVYVTRENNLYVINSQNPDLDANFIAESFINIRTQRSAKDRYVYEDEEKTIYYVIDKSDNRIVVSFVLATYVDYYIVSLYRQLTIIYIFLFIISFAFSLFVSNSISRPLILISKKIKDISNNNWDEEIPITRKDEIGHIQSSLEDLRTTLKSKERIQQEMFQNISHDLKTPIMIIEGYSQMILDGFVEKEELNETMESIMEEAKRLEKKVKALLYINKIDQLYADKKVFGEVDLFYLVNTVVTPFKKQFHSIKYIVDINSNDLVNGQFEEWRIALENIIDNMTRFAKSTIKVQYRNEVLTIYNDGEAIDENKLSVIFEPYGVGNKSNFGLGLTISKKILKTFGYHITVQNVSNGVQFEITKIYDLSDI